MSKGILTTQPSDYGPIFPVVITKADIILLAAKNAGHEVAKVYGYNSALTSDHRFKQCVDFMHYGNPALRLWLETYIKNNADALGVMGMISNRQCMGFLENETNPADKEVWWNGPSGVWRPYSGSNPHTDHVHVQFNTTPPKMAKLAKPAPNKHYVTMYCTGPTPGYAKPPAVGKIVHRRKKGFAVRGYPVHRSDGLYYRTKWGTDYPADHLSHTRPVGS